MTEPIRLNGAPSELKRLIVSLASKQPDRDDYPDNETGPWREYRKTTTIFAAQMRVPFEVDTMEGLHSGKAGDYLAVGIKGELYPIDADVMSKSYEVVSE